MTGFSRSHIYQTVSTEKRTSFRSNVQNKPPTSMLLKRYMVMKPMPKATEEIKVLANDIYQRMVAREDESIEKMRKVIEFATNDDCTLFSHYYLSLLRS